VKKGMLQEQYIVDEKGKKIAVILSIEKYKELLEDIHDLSIIAERQYEPTIAFEDLKKELNTEGRIYSHTLNLFLQ